MALQRELLESVALALEPGGELVYSVCTFAADEGPQQIDAFLADHPEFSIAAPREEASTPPWERLLDASGTLSTWPHRHGADAFFAARLIRSSGS